MLGRATGAQGRPMQGCGDVGARGGQQGDDSLLGWGCFFEGSPGFFCLMIYPLLEGRVGGFFLTLHDGGGRRVCRRLCDEL
jgi:hypothetical protein